MDCDLDEGGSIGRWLQAFTPVCVQGHYQYFVYVRLSFENVTSKAYLIRAGFHSSFQKFV